MGWSIGEGENGRDIGYGVPAICDHPKCNKKIDRGISYMCEICGMFFCEEHLTYVSVEKDDRISYAEHQRCPRCIKRLTPYNPKPDILEWIAWKLYDESWEEWRNENKEEVEKLKHIIIKI